MDFYHVFGLQEGFFLYTSVKENFMQVHILLVQQRLPGKEIWLFKSEFTSVDASSLSVVWGFLLSFFLFFLLSSERVQMGRSVVISDNDCVECFAHDTTE